MDAARISVWVESCEFLQCDSVTIDWMSSVVNVVNVVNVVRLLGHTNHEIMRYMCCITVLGGEVLLN